MISKSYSFYPWTKDKGIPVPKSPFTYPIANTLSLPPRNQSGCLCYQLLTSWKCMKQQNQCHGCASVHQTLRKVYFLWLPSLKPARTWEPPNAPGNHTLFCVVSGLADTGLSKVWGGQLWQGEANKSYSQPFLPPTSYQPLFIEHFICQSIYMMVHAGI